MSAATLHPIGLSLLSVVWWVGVWGLSESLLHILFKESVFMRLGVYVLLLASVLLVVLLNPALADSL